MAVLDLDAENVPGVRPYTDQDHQAQVELWNQNPEFDALFDRMRVFKSRMRKREMGWNKPLEAYDTRRLSARDILQVALLGPPRSEVAPEAASDETAAETSSMAAWSPGAGTEQLTRSILYPLGVEDDIIDDQEQLIRVLLARLQVQSKMREAEEQESNKPGVVERRDDLSERIKGQDLSTIQRLIGPHLRTKRDLNVVAQSQLESACGMEQARADPELESRVISFLNNVGLNMASHDMVIPKHNPHIKAILRRTQRAKRST